MENEVLIAAIGAMVVAWKTFDFWVKARQERLAKREAEEAAEARDQQDRLEGFLAVRDVQATLNQILIQAEAKQVVLLAAHDSGAEVRPGVELWSSVLNEVRAVAGDTIRSWQRQRLDDWYIAMLAEVIDQGAAYIVRDQMPSTPLRDTYAALGLTHSRVKFVHATEDSRYIYYISIASDGPLDWEAEQRDRVRAAVGELQRILERYEIPPEYAR